MEIDLSQINLLLHLDCLINNIYFVKDWKLFESNCRKVLNIGSEEQVSINQMIGIIEDISGINKLNKNYQLDKPKGVRGRSSNNDLIKKVLNWSYKMSLKDGLMKTYDWIENEMDKKGSNLSKFTKS